MIEMNLDKNVEQLVTDVVLKTSVVLNNGGVAVLPTDTVYGLHCLANKASAIERIANMKGREENKPFLLLINSWEMLAEWVEVSDDLKKYLATVWPGKNTIILQAKKEQPGLVSQVKTIAVRWPASPKLQQGGPADMFLDKLLTVVSQPLVSTSLNKAGELNLVEPVGLANYFASEPDIVVNAGPQTGSASRIIDARDLNNIIVIRE